MTKRFYMIKFPLSVIGIARHCSDLGGPNRKENHQDQASHKKVFQMPTLLPLLSDSKNPVLISDQKVKGVKGVNASRPSCPVPLPNLLSLFDLKKRTERRLGNRFCQGTRQNLCTTEIIERVQLSLRNCEQQMISINRNHQGKSRALANRIENLMISFFLGASGDKQGDRVIIGKLKIQVLPGNKLAVQIPYFAPDSVGAGRGVSFNMKKVDALGLAITQLVNPHPLPSRGNRFCQGTGQNLCTTEIIEQVQLSLRHFIIDNSYPQFERSSNSSDSGSLKMIQNAVVGDISSKRGKKEQMSVELRLVGLRYPYLDNFILAQYVAYNAVKYNFTRMHKLMFKKRSVINLNQGSLLPNDTLPGHVEGLKLELAGRLTTQRSIPRKTVSNQHTGSFKVNKDKGTSVEMNQYASKNKLGAYTIKVWLSQKVNL